MKSKYYILLLLSGIVSSVFSQNIIQYTYDADGNMESRYTVTLRSARINEQGQIDEVEPETKENFSIKLNDKQITIYPNPTQGEICVKIVSLNPEEENFIRLFEPSGHLIETRKIESERTYLKISGNPGIYLLNIHLGADISKWKIIKQ